MSVATAPPLRRGLSWAAEQGDRRTAWQRDCGTCLAASRESLAAMRVLLAHYQEIALKGQNRPWFIRHLARNLRDALAGLDVGVRTADGPDRDRPRAHRRYRRSEAAAAHRVRTGQLRCRRYASRLISTPSPRRWCATCRATARCRASASRCAVPTSSSRSPRPTPSGRRQPDPGRDRLARRPVESRLRRLGGDRAASGLLLLRQGGRARRPAGGHRRPRPGPALRRHRLAGGGVADDAARLSRDLRPLPRPSVHLARVEGQGARAGACAGAVPARRPRHVRAVRRAAAPGDDGGAGADAGCRLPPSDAAHRQAAGHYACTRGRWSPATSSARSRRRPSTTSPSIDGATDLLTVRPLVGMDKEEIIAEGVALGTYPISILPDEDCCTLFTPRHPLHARPAVRGRSAPSGSCPWRRWSPPRTSAGCRAGRMAGDKITSCSRTLRGPHLWCSIPSPTSPPRSGCRHHQRRAITVSAAAPAALVDRLALTAAFGGYARGEGHGALGHPAPGGRARRALRLDSRPLPGDGPRRGRRLHGAGDQRPGHGLRHRRAPCCAPRNRLDAGAFILEIARSEIGYTEQRPHEYAAVMAGRRAARRLPRAAVHAGRSLPGQR